MNDLEHLLEELYPEHSNQVIDAVENTFDDEAVFTKKKEDWYKQLQLYVTYPDAFWEGNVADFSTLQKNLSYIKNLGCNAVHVLPFLASPQVDLGFDISDFYLVREDLGGNTAFDDFLSEARKLDLAVFMDIVLNHVSQEHRWFLQAQSGDSFYRDFFVTSRKKPELVKKFTDDKAVWARYRYGGKEHDARIIFPEQAGELPHWRQGDDSLWYYHTFYPHQLDLDWTNYHVFVAMAKVLVYWAKKGVHFRLDAIPFVGKNVRKGEIESTDETHMVVQAMHEVVKYVSGDGVFLVEANQPVDDLVRYFGSESKVESELAYDFPLMNALWVALLKQNVDVLWSCLEDDYVTPRHAGWVTFLRNHDELSLENASKEDRELIVGLLSSRGELFREGFGVSGRTMSLLDNNSQHLLLAYMLLLSLPGNPAIIYGDELGKTNEHSFMEQQTRWKRERFGDNSIADDTRDINRGSIVKGKETNSDVAKNIYSQISGLFTTRLKYIDYFMGLPERIRVGKKSVFAVEYGSKAKRLVGLVNLSEQKVDLDLEFSGKVLFQVGQYKLKDQKCILEGLSGVWLEIDQL